MREREQIFHYVYACCITRATARYAENLKRELPGTAEDFHPFATAGRKLADLHVGYVDSFHNF